jgi:putative phosphoribosyl transferase
MEHQPGGGDMFFEDRRQAGRALAEAVVELELDDPVVLALPRGGVPVGFEIAQRLGAPLDVLVVRKLGVPGHEELAMGAIASGGTRVLNSDVVFSLRISDQILDAVAAHEQRELERRERLFRGERPPIAVAGRSVILVDDGLATGATMRAAALSLRQRQPREIIAAVPVGAPSGCALLARLVDRVVCLAQPEPFHGVGIWYRNFEQTSDEEVRGLLEVNRRRLARASGDRAHREVVVHTDDATLHGVLAIPADAVGLVVFAHGSGSGRHSPRNRQVAHALNRANVATLLFDLLTSEEGERDAIDASLRFDIDRLARRVIGAVDWACKEPELRELPIGLFGASTGAAAALVAAAARPDQVAAVVSRGGRPDLADVALPRVRAPTLLIVGGRDTEVLRLNKEAREQMQTRAELAIVEGATHLFEEPGTLEQVASLAARFLRKAFAATA